MIFWFQALTSRASTTVKSVSPHLHECSLLCGTLQLHGSLHAIHVQAQHIRSLPYPALQQKAARLVLTDPFVQWQAGTVTASLQ
jgi:hypothetical protein